MPTVPKGSLVLISGPSGFLGARKSAHTHSSQPTPLTETDLSSRKCRSTFRRRPIEPNRTRNKRGYPTTTADCAQQLLEHGFRVRGTVRSQDKGQYLADLFKKQGYGEDKFEFVIVEDVEAVRLSALSSALFSEARTGY